MTELTVTDVMRLAPSRIIASYLPKEHPSYGLHMWMWALITHCQLPPIYAKIQNNQHGVTGTIAMYDVGSDITGTGDHFLTCDSDSRVIYIVRRIVRDGSNEYQLSVLKSDNYGEIFNITEQVCALRGIDSMSSVLRYLPIHITENYKIPGTTGGYIKVKLRDLMDVYPGVTSFAGIPIAMSENQTEACILNPEIDTEQYTSGSRSLIALREVKNGVEVVCYSIRQDEDGTKFRITSRHNISLSILPSIVLSLKGISCIQLSKTRGVLARLPRYAKAYILSVIGDDEFVRELLPMF